MHSVLKSLAAIAATIVACAIVIPVYIYVASEAVIARRYPLPVIGEPAVLLPDKAARGKHLARLAGCTDCHGGDLEGRPASVVGALPLWSSNLRLAAAKMSDGEFERALRHGIAPDATSLWGMPSQDYTYMSETDVAALLAWLRRLGPAGAARPGPAWNRRARLALLEGRIVPSALQSRDAPSSLDIGPRYDGGRYLARVACSECHGTDLDGVPAQRSPDLDVISLYSRPAFFDLLRRGIGVHGRHVPAMRRLAAIRFHVLADYEIMALYDYLDARAHAPPELIARAKANEARRKAEAADNED
ncbi:MAG TPA: c-type cytochrome [Rhizomicrobium sp.]|nr:c-type cytochrome [Rhizomicrobium sp.]